MVLQKHNLRERIIPEMDVEIYKQLKESISKNGYNKAKPILLFENKILDGYNRYKASAELDIKPVFKSFKGDILKAFNYLLDTHLERISAFSESLSESQRAIFIVELQELEKEISQKSCKIATRKRKTNEILADNSNTSARYISYIKKIRKEHPELIELIERGDYSISQYIRDTSNRKPIQEKDIKALSSARLERILVSGTKQQKEKAIQMIKESIYQKDF